MNGINDFALNQYLARRLNVTDSPAPANTLAPEVMPVLLALQPSQEDLYLRGERSCGVSSAVSALALNYSVITLSNPANSGMLVLLDWMQLYFGTANHYQNHFLERVSLPAMGAVNGSVLDSRWPLATGGARRHAAIVGAGNTVTAPNINWARFLNTRSPGTLQNDQYNLGLTIAPGSMYICYTEALASDIGLSLKWRERPAQPSELV